MTPLDPALLAAILAEPDDDGVRLAASDWWEEHGEPERAEFVRVQVELASVDDGSGAPPAQPNRAGLTLGRWQDLRRREGELLRGGEADPGKWGANSWAWFVGQFPVEGCQWRRGFVEHVICTAAAWIAHADVILAAQPVQKVRLTTVPDIEGAGSTHHGGRRLYRLRGRRKQRIWNPEEPARRRLLALLEAEWPRVRFTVPPVSAPFEVASQNILSDTTP